VDVELDLSRALRGDVEFPDAEVVLKHDHFAVGTDRGPTHVAALERRHTIGFAAVFGDAPDVCESVAVAIADEINEAVMSPHGPRVETVEVSDLRKLFRR